ncbi:MAG: SMC-Scp complex subunit ScpB [Clostridia bacterium]|nr:SMC-Scp complex subunit ScpB [Clostridia bacterium]
MTDGLKNRIECILFVSGEPVSFSALALALDADEASVKSALYELECEYRDGERGIQLLSTDRTAQLISNRSYAADVERLLQPEQVRSASRSLLETLAVIAYRQPVTRADIEGVRGVRCEYAVSQLQKLGLIEAVGRKDSIGKPMLFGTTDKFLHKFGLRSLAELPDYMRNLEIEDSAESSLI